MAAETMGATVATDVTLPPGLRARLFVFLPPGQRLPTKAAITRYLEAAGVEGLGCLGTQPRTGSFEIQIPLLLPGRRLKEILGGLLPGGFVVREARELGLLVDTAASNQIDLGWRGAVHLAMVDNLARGEVGRTMVEVQAAAAQALVPSALSVAILSHFDFLLSAPPMPEALEALSLVHGSLLGGRPTVVARGLRTLDLLRARIRGRPRKVA